MATRTPVYTDIPDTSGGAGSIVGKKVVWSGLLNTDVGLPIPKNLAAFVDRSFQASGTFGGAGSVAIEGANDDDGTGATGNFCALTNPTGTTIALTANTIVQQATEAVVNMRPRVTAGDGTTTLTVTGFLRRAMR